MVTIAVRPADKGGEPALGATGIAAPPLGS
jgi:hypothetical protein